MIRFRSKEVRFRLAGGLGNQLLQYFGALSLHQKLLIRIKLDRTEVDISHTDGKYDLRSFVEPNNNFVFEDMSNNQVALFSIKFLRKFRFCFPIRLFVKIFFENRHQINNFLFDISQSIRAFRLIEVQGWFANFEYFYSLPEASRSLTIRNPSERFISYSSELQGKDYVAVHVRLGDYLANSDVLGVLSKEYYLDAFQRLDISYDEDFIVIFSNDSSLISEFIDLRLIRNYLVVDSSPDFDPAEAFILMSRAKKLVIANSTFSYTAALLSSQDAVVAFPRFNKQGEEYILNAPVNWLEISPKWI